MAEVLSNDLVDLPRIEAQFDREQAALFAAFDRSTSTYWEPGTEDQTEYAFSDGWVFLKKENR